MGVFSVSIKVNRMKSGKNIEKTTLIKLVLILSSHESIYIGEG
jgi:hypothetical protein